jgi:ribosomal protein S6--L-glutamate ligase/tetrahydromethanopterin:alpha-L-glutamate ligase
MRIGILTRNPNAWCSSQIIRAVKQISADPVPMSYANLVARVGLTPKASGGKGLDLLNELDAIIVRPIGRGSLDEIIFRLNLLHRLNKLGLPIFNNPSSIERAVDKYYSLALMEEKGIPVPRTIVTESPNRALDAFYELGGDVVVKPVYGSQGIGVTRVSDPEVALRVFRALAFVHHVLYVQEFVTHGNRDLRVFVIGGDVVAAMYRISEGWKTNIHQGASPLAMEPDFDLCALAVSSAQCLGCDVAGVDVMEGSSGYVVNEVNSQPGFQGLQSTTDIDIALKIVEFVRESVE